MFIINIEILFERTIQIPSIGAFRTNSTESILCYAREMPLQFVRDKTELTYVIRRKT